jgi:hypothetical protein
MAEEECKEIRCTTSLVFGNSQSLGLLFVVSVQPLAGDPGCLFSRALRLDGSWGQLAVGCPIEVKRLEAPRLRSSEALPPLSLCRADGMPLRKRGHFAVSESHFCPSIGYADWAFHCFLFLFQSVQKDCMFRFLNMLLLIYPLSFQFILLNGRT